MAKYRKKPVVVEAIQYLPKEKNYDEVAEFLGWDQLDTYVDEDDKTFPIQTLEGTMIVCPCDWIIKGVKGEFYPCKPDIFEQTYEPVEEKED